MGFCLAERQHSAKKVEESRSFSTGVTSQAAQRGSAARRSRDHRLRGADRGAERAAQARGGPHVGWCNSSIPLLVSLNGVKAQAARLAGGCNTPDGISRILQARLGWCSMLIDWQFKIITVSALQPPPAISLESLCRADSILQTPCTTLCLDIYEPQANGTQIREGFASAKAGWSFSWAWKCG